MHSVEYRRPQPLFVKKRVLVVGLGKYGRALDGYRRYTQCGSSCVVFLYGAKSDLALWHRSAGSSAIDIALEAKNYASEVQLTSRRGSWLLPRFYKSQPYDHWYALCACWLPRHGCACPSYSLSFSDQWLCGFTHHAMSCHAIRLRLTRASYMAPACLRDWFIKHIASYVPQGHRNASLPLRRYHVVENIA